MSKFKKKFASKQGQNYTKLSTLCATKEREKSSLAGKKESEKRMKRRHKTLGPYVDLQFDERTHIIN